MESSQDSISSESEYDGTYAQPKQVDEDSFGSDVSKTFSLILVQTVEEFKYNQPSKVDKPQVASSPDIKSQKFMQETQVNQTQTPFTTQRARTPSIEEDEEMEFIHRRGSQVHQHQQVVPQISNPKYEASSSHGSSMSSGDELEQYPFT